MGNFAEVLEANLKMLILSVYNAKYGIFMPKTNIGLQQHIYLEQSILMQISNLEH